MYLSCTEVVDTAYGHKYTHTNFEQPQNLFLLLWVAFVENLKTRLWLKTWKQKQKECAWIAVEKLWCQNVPRQNLFFKREFRSKGPSHSIDDKGRSTDRIDHGLWTHPCKHHQSQTGMACSWVVSTYLTQLHEFLNRASTRHMHVGWMCLQVLSLLMLWCNLNRWEG